MSCFISIFATYLHMSYSTKQYLQESGHLRNTSSPAEARAACVAPLSRSGHARPCRRVARCPESLHKSCTLSRLITLMYKYTYTYAVNMCQLEGRNVYKVERRNECAPHVFPALKWSSLLVAIAPAHRLLAFGNGRLPLKYLLSLSAGVQTMYRPSKQGGQPPPRSYSSS